MGSNVGQPAVDAACRRTCLVSVDVCVCVCVCVRSYLERAPIALKDVVLLVHRFDTAKLIKACNEEEMDVLTMEGGLFDKLCSLYQLDDTLGCDVELVCFGLSGSVHFSERCWVVNAARLDAFDSMTRGGRLGMRTLRRRPSSPSSTT
jgi:hypothetical protein